MQCFSNLQRTECYTLVSTTVQPALMGVQNSAELQILHWSTALYRRYFVAVLSLTYTPILPTFLKITKR